MNRFRKKILSVLGSLLSAVAIYLASVLAVGWYHDWVPAATDRILPRNIAEADYRIADSVLSFVIWNIGYGGLGQESDFFFDDEGIWYSGSSMVHAPKPLVEKNMLGIVKTIASTKADFFLIQEMDEKADRSYHINQFETISRALPGFMPTMATNYRCRRVPIPLLEPWNNYGAVESGLGTFARFQHLEGTRHQLPGKYPMPDRLFQLDRCVALHRFTLKNGKQLVVMNLHNAAHDPGDKIKSIQLPFIRDLAVAEYEKGNYVVLGGDWNQCPPYFRFDAFSPGFTQGYHQGNVPDDMFPDNWRYAYDPAVPTNRKCRNPYTEGKTFVTLIDFFLVSPNVQVREVKGLDQKFEYSDHQPVWMEVLLMEGR